MHLVAAYLTFASTPLFFDQPFLNGPTSTTFLAFLAASSSGHFTSLTSLFFSTSVASTACLCAAHFRHLHSIHFWRVISSSRWVGWLVGWLEHPWNGSYLWVQ